jgi:putative membrane protein
MSGIRKNGFIYTYIIRWIVCSLGLWVAASLLQGSVNYQNRISVIVIAGAILALLNAIIKPLLVIASLPAILLTLGIFMLVINGTTVYIMSKLYAPLQITSFAVAVLTGLIIGLVNYLVTAILEAR